jgi:hypothetical protein
MLKMRLATGFALLAVSTVALAVDASGTYMTFTRSVSETTMPDGSHARLVHSFHVATSNKADSPFDGKTSECVGRMIVSSAGKVVSGGGFCFAQDAAGNGGSWSWKIEATGTPECPQVCGTFKWLEGYGDSKHVTATGTWTQKQRNAEGGLGVFTVKYTL